MIKNIFRVIIITIFIILSGNSIKGQSIKNLSLEKAINIAMQNNAKYKEAVLNERLTNSNLKKAYFDRLPSVSGSLSLQRNLIIPVTPVPKKIVDPTANADDIVAAQFATQNTGNIGLKLSYDIFNPEDYGSISTKELENKKAAIDTLIERELIKENVTIDYAAVLIASEQITLTKKSHIAAYQFLSFIKERNKKGLASSDDIAQAVQSYNNTFTKTIDALSILLKSKVKLLGDLGIKAEKEDLSALEITDSLSSLIDIDSISDNNLIDMDTSNLAKSKDSIDVDIKSLALLKAKLSFLPTLSITAYYGANYYNKAFQYLDSKFWYGNSYVSIGLSLPISSILSNIKAVNSASIERQVSLMKQKQNEITRSNETMQRDIELLSAIKILKVKESNKALAQKRLDILISQMNQGKVYPYQMTKGLNDIELVNADYLQALYNVIIAKANKDIAKLK